MNLKNRTMNILNITTISGLRGGDIQMHTIYKLLKTYNSLNQYILCPDDSDLYEMNKEFDENFISYKKSNKIFSAIKPILKTIKEKNINIIHVHDSSALSAVLIASIFFSSEIKIIFSRKRDKAIKRNILGKIKYGNKRIDKIVCVSNAVASVFDYIIKDKSKIQVIYDGIDVSKFEISKPLNLIRDEIGVSDDYKIVGNIAALENQKDIKTFVNAVEYVKQMKPYLNVKYVIIGEGKEREKLEVYIKDKKLEGDIYFFGFRKNVNELLPEFDVFMMSSISEGLPLTIYEAFACKVPVVSTKAGGIPEAVINNFSGLTSEIKDYKSLGDNLIKILTDDKLKKIIIENAFQMVKERFDLPVLEKNYYHLYKTI